jgi:hypothetical protein
MRVHKSNSRDEISSFHQPYRPLSKGLNTFQDSKKNERNMRQSQPSSMMENEEELTQIFFKFGDGRWSSPAIVPKTGSSHGIIRLPSARWPSLTRSLNDDENHGASMTGNGLSVGVKGPSKIKMDKGCSSSGCLDLSYRITAIEGLWGEFSRLLVIYPRFYVRNDSQHWFIEVKQTGTPDKSALQLKPGCSKPFYWTDLNIPELMCVRLLHKTGATRESCKHGWSGGFDISALGMIPLRIQTHSTPDKVMFTFSVVRVLVELRSGTGGTGLIVSLKDELESGEDALYRVENLSPFPVWISQDGTIGVNSGNGDMIPPNKKVAYGLYQPYRNEKMNSKKWIGIALIMLGVIFIGIGA